jgi:hypothetical protein
MGVDAVERGEGSSMTRVLHGPERPQGSNSIVHPPGALGERHPRCRELGLDVPGTDADDQAPAGNDIKTGQLLR